MIHLFRIITSKIIAVVASAIIAVGIVHVPQISNTPIVHKTNTSVVSGTQTANISPIKIVSSLNPKPNHTPTPTPSPDPIPLPTFVPTPTPTPTTATLQVVVDAVSCTSQATNVQVFVDAALIGTIPLPGGYLTTTLGLGGHTISAQSSNNLTWASNAVQIAVNGFKYTLTCNAPTPTPTAPPIVIQPPQQPVVDPAASAYQTALYNYFKAEDVVKQEIRDEVAKSGGFITDSQLEVMAIQRLKDKGITMPIAPTALARFQNLCNNVEDDIRKEVASANGFATESQIQALAYNRKKSLGCYNGTIPTAECNDFTPTYSTDWQGACSDHGGIYMKF